MTEIVQMIGETGILVVIAGAFITLVMMIYKDGNKRSSEAKQMQMELMKQMQIRDDKYIDSLQLISKAIDNTSKSLDLLTQSNENTVKTLAAHDERSIEINDKLTEIKGIMSRCNKK